MMQRILALFMMLTAWASPALADFCMLTQNGLHLGRAEPADPEGKRAALALIFKDYDVVSLQEVMDPNEPARLAPPGFAATVSTAKGRSSYREHYALLTRDAAIRVLAAADYPDMEEIFARPPFGIAVEDRGGARYWLVDIHAVFGKGGPAPRRQEVAAMERVFAFYAGQRLPDGTSVERVMVAGDWNLPATDPAFADLALAAPGVTVAPNVKSTLNARGAFASPYDHFVWDRRKMGVAFADEPRDTGGLPAERFRATVSDHVGVAGYVVADPAKGPPPEVNCPPARPGAGS